MIAEDARDHRPRGDWIAAVAAVLLVLGLHQLANVTVFPYDSEHYWLLSQFKPFKEVPPGWRGYLYPTLLAPASWLSEAMGDSKVPYRIISSLVYGIALSGFVTTFFFGVFKGRATSLRRLVVPALVVVIFPGLILYPLSDLPALLFMIAAVSLSSGARPASLLRYAAVGALCYAAYNIRSIYLFPSIVLGVYLTFRATGIRARLVAVALFMAGAGLLAVPQMFVNKQIYGVYSPWVAVSSGSSLMANQLRYGVAIDKYETSVNTEDPSPQVVYLSPNGRAILEANPDFNNGPTIAGYLRISLQSPFEFISTYLRHLVSGLDVRDGMVYTPERSTDRNIWSAVHFCFLWLATITLVLLVPWRHVSLLPLVVLIIPAVLIVPGAIETRFLLPAHMLLYGCVASRFGLQDFVAQLRRRPIVAAAVAGFYVASFAVATWITMPEVTYGLKL